MTQKALFFFLPLFITAGFAGGAPRPNILYFYVDDMGWGSIGPNGQAERRAKGLPSVKTPNLDQLAAEGINFTRAYGCTVCSPARSSQQTGFHQGHTFADRNDPDNARKAMRSDDVSMGDALSAAGYVTGYWGKWGFGGSKDMENPQIDNVQTLPTSHGYKHVLAELHHVRAHTFFQPTLWSAPPSHKAKGGLELIPNTLKGYRGRSDYPKQPSNHNHPDYPETAYCDDLYAFAAHYFVRQQAANYSKTGEPFFALLAVQIPHAPFDEIAELPDWDSAYQDDPHFSNLAKQAQQWAAMVTRIDAHFGNILAALDDPNGDGDPSDSVSKETLVIFMSDNGGPGGPSLKEFNTNGGLRGTKGKIHEGGIRVPTIMRWPEMITDQSKLRAGTSSDRVIDVTDLLPTFCELAGIESPVGLDGVSLAPLLTGEGERREREFLIHEAGKGKSIIRGKHKLIWNGKQDELYDLEADHSEETDISSQHPKLVKELKNLLLGERVGEPKGFANTYHRWIGKNGAAADDADNWTDYRYENDGVTYLTDDGPPRISWIARMENAGKEASTSVARTDLEFLGLEVRGESAPQELVLTAGAKLTGRNEIRIGENGAIKLDGGTLNSLRWVDVKEGGVLSGNGEINAPLFNAGKVTLTASEESPASAPQLIARGDYLETPEAWLELQLSGRPLPETDGAPFLVMGNTQLKGRISIAVPRNFSCQPGDTFPLLRAKKIEGRFSNPHDRVTATDGTRFEILYRPDEIQLRSVQSPDQAERS